MIFFFLFFFFVHYSFDVSLKQNKNKTKGVHWDEQDTQALKSIHMFEVSTDEKSNEAAKFIAVEDDESVSYALLKPDLHLPQEFNSFLKRQGCILVWKFPEFHEFLGFFFFCLHHIFFFFKYMHTHYKNVKLFFFLAEMEYAAAVCT